MPGSYSLQQRLNELAGTSGLAPRGSANAWAGTTGLDLVGALNVVAGTQGLDLGAVCNAIAGTSGLAPVKALEEAMTSAQITALLANDSTTQKLPVGWNSNWLAAKSAGSPKIGVVGDSVSLRYWASSGHDWVSLLRAELQATYGNGGSGFQGATDTAEVSSGSVNGYTAEKVATTGTWTAGASDSLNGPGSVYISGSSSSPGTATFHVTGSTVRVYSLTLAAGGTMSVTIDGVAKTAVNTAGSNGVQSTSYTGLTTGAHTVVITNDGVSGKFVNLCGVSGHNASGASIDNFSGGGRSGLSFSGYDGTGTPVVYGNPALWSGGPSYPVSPDLLVYSLGINDAVANRSPLDFQTTLKDWAKVVREGTKQPDLLFVLQHIGSGDDGDATYRSGFYAEYSRVMEDFAEAYGAGFINLWALGRNSWAYNNTLNYWGTDATGVSGSDSIHPSTTGHAIIKGVVSAALAQTT